MFRACPAWFALALLALRAFARAEDAASPATPPNWPPLIWGKGAPSPFARVEAPAAVLGGKLYLFGGSTETLDSSNRVDVYDPATDSWSQKKEMPTQVTHLNTASDGQTVWLAGGFKGKHPGPVTDEVWKYDVAADSWSAGPHLPEPRGGGGLAILAGRLHYFGGYQSDRDTNSGDHWSMPLDGSTGWEPEAPMPEPRGHVAAAVLEGQMYALGGDHGHDKTQIDLPFCHRFDPVAKQWSAIASLPDGHSHFESSTIIRDGRIVIVGGRLNQTPRNVVADLMEYDPKADAWQVVAHLPRPLLAPAAGIISESLIVVAGGLNNPRPLTAETWVARLSGR